MGQSIKLYKHQEELVKLNPERHLLVWATGSGKTLASIALAQKNKVSSCLIICPKGLKTNWGRQVLDEPPAPKVKVMSKEEFRKDWDKIGEYEAVIVDESHYFSSRSSQMSKNLAKYLKKHDVKYRWLLSATPFLRDPWNIYVLANHLGHNLNYMTFKDTFFYDQYFGRRVVPMARPGMGDVLKELILRIGSTKKLEECVDVPEQTYEAEFFSPTKSQKDAIKELNETNHITRWTKIHQILNGSLGGDEFSSLRVFESEKRERIREIVSENPRSIVVCRYRAEIEVLEEELGLIVPTFTLTGDTKNRQELLDELSKMDRYCLVVSAQLAEGWELQNCPLMVFYSLDFKLSGYIQMCGRIRRINDLHKNTYLHLVIADSIDEDVYKSMKKKSDFHINLYENDRPY